jgi:hypothetical protein
MRKPSTLRPRTPAADRGHPGAGRHRFMLATLSELEQRELLSLPSPEYYPEDCMYVVRSPWSAEATVWRKIAEYLDRTQRVTAGGWVKDLDYTIFDS